MPKLVGAKLPPSRKRSARAASERRRTPRFGRLKTSTPDVDTDDVDTDDVDRDVASSEVPRDS
jgi:hypothetical protein